MAERNTEWGLHLFAALFWGWGIEAVTRTVLRGYGLDLPGPQLGGVPLLLPPLWALLWLGLQWAAYTPIPLGGAVAIAMAVLWLSGAGWWAFLLGPVVVALFVAAGHTLHSIAPPGSGRYRVRLLLAIIIFTLVGLIYLQWLWLFTAVGE